MIPINRLTGSLKLKTFVIKVHLSILGVVLKQYDRQLHKNRYE